VGDLVLINGSKVDGQDLELSQIMCGQCDSGIFNWRAQDDGKLHLLGCCVCGALYPIIENPESDTLDLQDDDEE
jgi:hypothetical protein